jgi:NAD(P)-dependent dehydrogenase (short-subunit alcohol dehydrogenase family)
VSTKRAGDAEGDRVQDEASERGPLDLAGQVALVTGGNGGIGLGMAEGLVLAGADVAICGRNPDKVDAAVAQLRALREDVRVEGLRCDVAVEAEVVTLVQDVVERFGRLDSCVANAGISGDASVLEMSLDEWRRVMAVNLDGVFVTLREAARQMVEQGDGGALVAVSSTSSEHGAPRNAHYASSKAAVLALVRSMAVALARHGIRANSLVPGWTLTELTAAGYEYDKFRENTISRTPVRRWGEPADFRAVAPFLCDRRNVFHTGDEVTIDGGYTVF